MDLAAWGLSNYGLLDPHTFLRSIFTPSLDISSLKVKGIEISLRKIKAVSKDVFRLVPDLSTHPLSTATAHLLQPILLEPWTPLPSSRIDGHKLPLSPPSAAYIGGEREGAIGHLVCWLEADQISQVRAGMGVKSRWIWMDHREEEKAERGFGFWFADSVAMVIPSVSVLVVRRGDGGSLED